ncbi:hypothetical protein B0A48_01801 [Cryoendolithus antarcticus]|uniref:Uncharacterized protein n=1 Tax=Cryoendolithus antarcticus TaxID=1507870 RepID=A0A1V8TQT4_9PEZI|nr:hypothetical protein B0A48_01801 [Cryoendolithus antarcticus]
MRRTTTSLRALPAAISHALPSVEHACKCRCGASLRPVRALSTTSLRQREKAWSTTTQKRRVLNPADALKLKGLDKELDNLVNSYRHALISWNFNKGNIAVTAHEVDRFLTAYVGLCTDSKPRLESGIVTKFAALLETTKIAQKDVLFLSFMLQASHVKKEKPYGQKLLLLLSSLGYEEATVQLLYQVLLVSKDNPQTLKAATYSRSRGHLQRLAREGLNVRAMVLEGMIARFQGDQESAIKLWWSVLEDPVRLDYVTKIRPNPKETDAYNASLQHLATPWIELITIHFERVQRGLKDVDLLERALKIGMEQDDPVAFYWAASYREQSYANGDLRPTSEWLYLMTKAAASGVPKAAHELGRYYWTSGWKYIEDEPPAHIKPTPFDSFKPDEATMSASPSAPSTLRPADADQFFHTATYPSTPEQRAQLAMDWLRVAIDAMYAPSYLLMAEIANTRQLWAGAQAPAAALALSPERCTYASEVEYNNAVYDCEEGEDRLVTYTHTGDPEDDPPNPFYSLEAAKSHLVNVFRACKAVDFKAYSLKQAAAAAATRSNAVNEDDWAQDTGRAQDKPEFLKFYQDDGVYDSWAGEVSGLRVEAQAMCEKEAWTLYDETGGLVYRAGIGVVGNLEGIEKEAYFSI